MTRIFLTASVAALALASPALAGPHGHGRSDDAPAADGAQQQSPRQMRGQGGGHGDESPRMQQPRMEQPRMMERAQRPDFQQRMIQRAERQDMRPRMIERAQRPVFQQQRMIQRAERQDMRPRMIERAQRPTFQQRMTQRAERPTFQQRMFQRADRQPLQERMIQRRERQAMRVAEAAPRGLPQSLGLHDMGRHRGDEMRASARPRVQLGERIDPRAFSSAVPLTYRTRYADTPDYYYRYDDRADALYRVARQDNVVRSLIPLYGGYSVGDPWRDPYQSDYFPTGYRSLYYDTPYDNYRYGDNAIYRVDPTTQIISAVVALLTGQNLGVGQRLPSSYGVYNVPDAYRSNYYDTPNQWYRYDDGMIYQVDPYSRQIEASYPLYGDDYAVGSPWPVAYPDYNVPYGYQQSYYDSPQSQYRYAGNAIYQVDPKTRLIEALVSLVTGQQFAVGQQMPSGYSVYNVPDAYRDRYYDTADSMYRYNDGYVYQADPRTGLIEQRYLV